MQETQGAGPYAQASYLSKLRTSRVLALTDLDGTMTDGGDEPSEQELADRASVRELLEKAGVVAGAVTARTCGLTLSHDSLHNSQEVLLCEPPPRWGVESGRQVYKDLSRIKYFNHCLDWDFVCSFGSHLIVRNGTGYRVDQEYGNMLRYDYDRHRTAEGREVVSLNEVPWRIAMTSFLYEKCSWVREYMAPIEQRAAYDARVTNVAPLEFRFQLDFHGSKGFEAMRHLQAVLDEERIAGNSLAVRIAAIDESRMHEDPERCRYTLYLVPWNARKEKMIHRLFRCSVQAAGMVPKDVSLFYAGDTLTDLRAGLWAGGDAKLAFLLPKGSRLAPYLIERRPAYGSQDLSFLWDDPTRWGRGKARLVPTGRKGEYEFIHKIRGERKNIVVIADERYSHEHTAPGSVAAFLDEYLVRKRVDSG